MILVYCNNNPNAHSVSTSMLSRATQRCCNSFSFTVSLIVSVCDVLDTFEHGERVAPREEPVFNDVIKYSCNDNYILVGNSSITCGEYGEYSSPPPKCIGQFLELKFDSIKFQA